VTNVHTGWIDLRLVRDGPAMTCAIDLHAFPFWSIHSTAAHF
jgi:hypothetical protein